MQFNQYTASTTTLGSSSALTEQKYNLWVYSSGSAASGGTNRSYLVKGNGTPTNNTAATGIKLYTLSSNWNPNQNFALEVSLYSSSASYTATAQLYDVTSSSLIASSIINTTATTFTVLRSSQFTLIPSHSYAVSLISNNASGTTYITKAYLVALFN